MASTVRVCVVGAGGAGLIAARELLARGHEVDVLEARDGAGGLWRAGPGSPAYDSLRTNTSRRRLAMRAMPMAPQERGEHFVHHTAMLAHLESYARRFGVDEHVQTATPVRAAVPAAGGGWDVVAGDETAPRRYDAVVAASGLLARPRRPALPGRFDGELLHAAEYRSPAPYAGRDVVVAGPGTSGAEIAGELAGVARSVTMSARSSVHVAAKHDRLGLPVDLPDTALTSRMPWAYRRRVLAFAARSTAGRPQDLGLPAPDHRIGDQALTISDTFVAALRARRIAVRGAITRVDGDTVHFASGASQHADAVVLATGYDASYDAYLPDELVAGWGYDHAPALRGIAHLDAPGLHFAGLAIGLGALLPVFEAQGAWIAAVLADELPGAAAPDARAQHERERRRNARDFGQPDTVWRDRLRYVRGLHREVGRARRRRRAG